MEREDAIKNRLERARLLLERRRNDLAETELRILIQEDPHNALALAMLALCHEVQGRTQEAIDLARQALEADPSSGYAHYCSAYLDASRGRLSHALGSIDEALRLAPQDTDYLFLRAAILARMGRLEESQAYLSRLLRLSPECVFALVSAAGLPRIGSELSVMALQLLFPLNVAFCCERGRPATVMWRYLIIWGSLCLAFLLWTWYLRLFSVQEFPTLIPVIISVLLPVTAGQAAFVRSRLFGASPG